MVPAGMNLEYSRLTRTKLPDAYEHVLTEVLAGGHNVFPSGEEIDRSWELVEPVLRAWEEDGRPDVYARGSWGPGAADDLVASGGGRWINSGDEPGT
jgi:glucose-6-phosphate 1-dehydrogenase